MNNQRHKLLYFNYFLLGFFIIVLGIFLMMMPKHTDDYNFMYFLEPWFASQGIDVPENGGSFLKAGFPWKELVDSWQNRFYKDNSRLGNMLVIIFLCLPKWLGSGVALLCWTYAMIATLRMLNIDIRRSALVAVAVILWGFFMPWRNYMSSMVYQFNYLLATFINVIMLQMLCNRNLRGTLALAGFGIVSFLAGAWQEAFSIPILCGLGLLYICFRECRNKKMLICCICIILGIVWILISPGHRRRAGGAIPEFLDRISLMYLIKAGMTTLIYWAYVGMVIFGIVKNKIKIYGAGADKLNIFLLSSGFVSCLLVFIIDSDARVGWWSTFAGIAGIITLCRKYRPALAHAYPEKAIIFLTPLLLLLAVHFITVDYYVFKIRDLYLNGLYQYTKNPNGQIFSKIYDRNNIPLICGNMPDMIIFTSGNTHPAKYYRRDSSQKYMSFIPEELRYADISKGSAIPGSMNLRRYNGRYFRLLEDTTGYVYNLYPAHFDYGHGPVTHLVNGYQFTSQSDGRTYEYIYIHENLIENKLFKLQEANER